MLEYPKCVRVGCSVVPRLVVFGRRSAELQWGEISRGVCSWWRGAEGTVSERAHACVSGTVQVQDRGVAEEDAVMSEYWTALQIFSNHRFEPKKLPMCAGVTWLW